MFTPSSNEFKQEFEDLKLFIEDTKIFKVPETPSSTNACDRISNHSVVILSFEKDRKNWKKIFEKASQKSIPIIIYTFGDNRVEDDEMKEISQNYAYYTYAQNRLSLINCLYTTLATFNSYSK
jgi:isopentenyl diphosphate isomerase/L-lactate dehydrogenase-like FMN-dependent dehydrogenase